MAYWDISFREALKGSRISSPLRSVLLGAAAVIVAIVASLVLHEGSAKAATLISEPSTGSIINQPPQAQNDSYSTNEDTKLSVPAPGVLSNDTDPDILQQLTTQLVNGPSKGTLSLNSDGSFTYTPNSNANGTDTFTYRACDNGIPSLCSDAATVTINVNPVNDPPVAGNNQATIDEDTPKDITVLNNDSDPDGDRLTITKVSNPGNGTATINQDGTVHYVPNANFNGSDKFTYTVSDGNGGTDNATVTVFIRPVNDVPVNSVPGQQTTDEDTLLVFSAAGNNRISVSDVDAGSSPVKVALSVPSGTLTLGNTNGLTFSQGDGQNDQSMTFTGTISDINAALDGLRYDPAQDSNGSVNLTITTDDQGSTGNGGAKTDTDTVGVNIRAVNDAPNASDDSGSADEDSPTVIDVISNDSSGPADEQGQTLSLDSITAQPAHGGADIITSGQDAGKVRYTPDPDYNGDDSFSYRVCDSGQPQQCSTATVNVAVNAVNDPPRLDLNGDADGTGYSTTFQEGSGPVAAVDGNALTITDVDDDNMRSATVTLANNPDGNAESLTADTSGTQIQASYDPQSGVLALSGPASKADYQQVLRTVKYNDTSKNPDTSDRTINFVVNDGTDDSNTATSTISVQAVNDAPAVTLQGPTTADEGQSKTYNFTVSDPDSSGFTVTDGYPDCGQGGTMVQGSLTTDNSGGSFECRFPEGPASPTVRIQVTDPQSAASNIATQDVTVNNVPPQADSDGPYQTDEDQTLQVDAASGVLAGDTDPGNDPLMAVLVDGPPDSTGKLTLNDSGSFTFVPANDFNGQTTFTYRAYDGSSQSNPVTVTITVRPINDAPVAREDSAQTGEGTPTVINVLANDSPGPVDEQGQGLRVTQVSLPQHGAAEIIQSSADAGKVRYTPDSGYSGPDSFSYKVCDTGDPQQCDTAAVNVSVAAVNHQPKANPDQKTMAEGSGPASIDVLANDTDPDGNGTLDPGSVEVTDGPANGAATGNPDGSISYEPETNFNGQDTFTYRVCDGGDPALCDTATVMVDVTPVNDPPEAADDAAEARQGGSPVEISVLQNDTDGPDQGETLTITGNTQPPAGEGMVKCSTTSCTFTPNAGFSGTTRFTYTISDGNGGTDTATVTVNVSPAANGAPNASEDSYSADENQPLKVGAPGVLGNDSDPEHGKLTARVVSGAAHGKLALNPDGSFTYVPESGFSGQDVFAYRACDDGNPQKCSDPATVTITVKPAPPRADLSLTETGPGSVTVGRNFAYTIKATNQGPDTARDVKIKDPLPARLRFVSDSRGCSYASGNRTVTCRLGNLSDGATKTVRIVVQATRAGNIRNRATITSATLDPSSSNDADVAGTSAEQPEPSPGTCAKNFHPRKVIQGTPGDDVLRGTSGSEAIIGYGGNDIIYGGGGCDSIIAGNGRDKLYGEGGDDSLNAGEGNDILVGGSGNDSHNGGGGSDRIYARDGRKDGVNGGLGRDYCQSDKGESVTGCP